MSSQPKAKDASSPEANEVRALYQQLLQCWNDRDAAAFASLFTEDGSSIGFDGSQMTGRSEIETTLNQIFSNHPTGRYVNKIREVRFLTSDVAIVRAVVGMVPPDQSDLKPELNAIQTLVAVKQESTWRIALFQNTPAQFHGRPELAEELSEELRELI